MDMRATLEYLQNRGCKTVRVTKAREARLWPGSHGNIKVEWACISAPQAIVSIGLETWSEDTGGESVNDSQAAEAILAAINGLGLHQEPLQVMNYMEAVAVWAAGNAVNVAAL
jgi:hypothetical protein